MRTLTAVVASATKQDVILPIWFAELNFDAGPEYFSTATRDITFGGNTFIALGDFAGVSEITEGSDLSASGVILRISGIDPARISEALTEKVQGRTARLWTGFLDPTTYALLADPVGPFVFRMDAYTIVMGDEAVITLACESRAILWSKANVRRYTDADQQAVSLGDKFFEFVPAMADKELVWPGKASDVASPVAAPASRIPAGFVEVNRGEGDREIISQAVFDAEQEFNNFFDDSP